MGAWGFASSVGMWGHLLPQRRAHGVSLPWGQSARMAGWHARAVQAEDGGGQWHWGTPYLVDVRHHVSGGAPVRTELGRQGLPLLGEHTHMRGVHQHRQDTQALLLQWVEHHQEPAGGVTQG